MDVFTASLRSACSLR
ncbi:hypothetical protein YPPY09_1093, partial [Yersinia pestis PY-09]